MNLLNLHDNPEICRQFVIDFIDDLIKKYRTQHSRTNNPETSEKITKMISNLNFTRSLILHQAAFVNRLSQLEKGYLDNEILLLERLKMMAQKNSELKKNNQTLLDGL